MSRCCWRVITPGGSTRIFDTRQEAVEYANRRHDITGNVYTVEFHVRAKPRGRTKHEDSNL